MSLKNKTDIYDSPSQLLAIDPATIRLLSDRCLIRDLGDPERIGSIIIPEVARPKARDEWGTLRIGLVVATGPGDRFIEMGWDETSGVRRKLITVPCECVTCRYNRKRAYFNIVSYQLVVLADGEF